MADAEQRRRLGWSDASFFADTLVSGFSVSRMLKPVDVVSGTVADVVAVNESTVAAMMWDVRGHGLSSSFQVMALHGIFRAT